MKHSALFSIQQIETQHNPFKKLQQLCLGLCSFNTSQVLKLKKKIELDEFLKFIPDEPKMPNYVTAARINSILDQLSHLGLKKFT